MSEIYFDSVNWKIKPMSFLLVAGFEAIDSSSSYVQSFNTTAFRSIFGLGTYESV